MQKALSPIFKVSLCVLGCLCATSDTSLAQVTPDGTTNTTINPDGNNFTIENGDRAGGNLFHSFQDFSVPNGGSAFFNNATDISNIFSRVTGGNISNIDGLIRANGSASLFLINPAGIIFGEGARLDIGGSFYGSSATSILFEDGEFSATDLDNPPLLTVNAPIGLGFRDEPGDITIQGNGNGTRLLDSEVIDTQDALRVDSDATIGIVGGNIIFEDATIKTAGGRIEIGSVAGGEVDLVAEANGFTFDYSGIESFRDISLSGTSSIDASGLGGGDIQVAGRNISITGLSGFTSFTLGNEPGGDINVFASNSIDISGIENEPNFVSGFFNRTFPSGTADGGDINIETGSLSIGDRATITTFVSGQGNAGNININARDSVTLESQGNSTTITSFVDSDAIGNAGDINITSPSVTLSNGADLNVGSLGQGDAGDINIFSGNTLTVNDGSNLIALNSGLGAGGNVTINATDDVSFTNDSNISVLGAEGGSINITANNLSLISESNLFAGIAIDSGFADAQAGDIVINLTEDLILDGLDGAGATNITNVNFGTGNAGNIEISAGNITFNNGANISSFNTGEGNIGNITLTATGDILFDGIRGPFVSGIVNSVQEEATGEVGAINVTAQNLTLTNGANIQSIVSGQANSGDINLNIADTIRVDGFGLVETENVSGELRSEISSNVFLTGIGNSGDININTANLFLSGNGLVSTQTFGQGNAGDINVTAKAITLDGEGGSQNISPSEIGSDALSDLTDNPSDSANGGNIFIDTDSLSLINGGNISASNFAIGNGNSGDIKINAKESIAIDGISILLLEGEENEISSGVFASLLSSDAIGNGGSIEINTPQLSLSNEAQINAFTRGIGDAGSITINAAEFVQLSGNLSLIATDVAEGGIGNAGDLTIDTAQLTVSDGAQISTTTRGQGDAGSLTINARDFIQLSGINNGRSGLFASALEEDGRGGSIEIFTQDLILRDGAIINVSNFPSVEGLGQPGTGEAGNLTIEANSLRLENGGRIDAATQAGNGGNITLQIADDITLRDNSFISAQAFNQANGGNLTIDSRFIIAFPDGNNDIIANAEQGNGGRINITAESLFGIEERFLNPNTNDINASSEFSLDGTVTINTPDLNPIQGATELPSNVVEPEQTTAQACQSNRETVAKNSFIINGKGGVPPAPDMPLNSANISINGKNINFTSTTPQPIETSQGNIQPARGVQVTETGEVILTAYRTNNSGDRSPEIKPNCGV